MVLMHSLLPSADGDQRCHFKERGEKSLQLKSAAVIADEVSRKMFFFATYINAYLKIQYPLNCMQNLG